MLKYVALTMMMMMTRLNIVAKVKAEPKQESKEQAPPFRHIVLQSNGFDTLTKLQAAEGIIWGKSWEELARRIQEGATQGSSHRASCPIGGNPKTSHVPKLMLEAGSEALGMADNNRLLIPTYGADVFSPPWKPMEILIDVMKRQAWQQLMHFLLDALSHLQLLNPPSSLK
jgi:hypothetical protein